MTGTLAAATTSSTEAIGFWLLAPLAVLASVGMLLVKKAVHSALLLVVTMVVLAAFYLAQSAPFLGVVQIVVYTGAVMMLFLFVLMLVGVDSSESLVETIRGQRLVGLLLALGFAAIVVGALGRAAFGDRRPVGLGAANAQGNVQGIAQLLFTRYVFAFEVTSALLITAALGAMVLTHREAMAPRLTQRELSEARFRSSTHPGPLPPPGVYARHNAVDFPALLPDGTTSDLSVSKVLVARGDVQDIRHGAHPVADDVREIEESGHP
ncbi:NADH-quinone oxidoreductase subunit J [Motilibacter peucedani]|uniref:NADH-quinone oxidoreductase subunit J n=1 Tax=Motilibacter peucedani TaxID=598650 RepID=A0A420XKM1_9ACTN|nr:NADH-quinone oxidoreductase subunit J [Motilibacter peucedani]RKS69214.1 NADH-quinone oxidoreductase subunit J [Motilibacter peucedani]